MKVVEEYNVATDVEASNIRRANKGLSRITVDALFDNQSPSMADHLKHDNAHRMMEKFRAAPRNTPFHLVGAHA